MFVFLTANSWVVAFAVGYILGRASNAIRHRLEGLYPREKE